MKNKPRAWHVYKQTMCEIIRIDFEEELVTLDLETDWGETGCWTFSSVKIMQSTGLKDKNGVGIYEGDIVERVHLFNGSFGEKHTGEVVYDKKRARYVISKPFQHIKLETEELRNALSDVSTYEVIGNIWENSELLEEEMNK